MFSTAIDRLPSLPAEVVHKILGDFQLVRILHIICAHDIPYLDYCVASHLHIGSILSQERLGDIKELFTLYLDILKLYGNPGFNYPRIPVLECDAVTFTNRGRTTETVVREITSAIVIKLDYYDTYREGLQLHTPRPLPSINHIDTTDAASLRHYFESYSSAEMALNKKKSDQLKWIARLDKEYPRSLKLINNKSQDVRRNKQHLIDRMSVLSEKMLRPQLLKKNLIAARIFATHYLFLVPYDRLLRGFLKVLSKFPAAEHAYPPEMTRVIEGMQYVYRRQLTPTPNWMRTRYTPYSPPQHKKCGGKQQPEFVGDFGLAEFSNVNDRIQPIDNRELEWLESFLKVCSYMSSMQEEWKQGMSVEEYWKLHYY